MISKQKQYKNEKRIEILFKLSPPFVAKRKMASSSASLYILSNHTNNKSLRQYGYIPSYINKGKTS